jgi:hypothetical protein
MSDTFFASWSYIMLSEPQMPTIHPAVQAAENWLPPSVGGFKVEKK